MISNLLFIVEILISEHLFAFKLKHRQNYALRLTLSSLLLVACAFILGLFYLENFFYSCFVYMALFALTLFALKLVYNEPWVNVFFCGIAAYTLQHLAYQFANLVFSLVYVGTSPLLGIYHVTIFEVSELDENFVFTASLYVMCFFTVYWLIYLKFGKNIVKNGELEIKNKYLLVLVAACLVINIVLNSVSLYYGEALSFVNSVIYYVYICFCCYMLLQWQFELSYSKQLSTELDFVKKLLQQEKEHYKLFKDNIELINMKCHDMKHQIREIGINKGLNKETVEEIEQSISIYDSVVKTDNEALDVILTEKSLKCLKHNITFSYIADGIKLNFMKGSDIYSLFGNAIDNAIEAVLKFDDYSKRVIGLKICEVGNMITVNVKNFYEGKLVLDNEGFPTTTKSDTAFHGFGLKSMKMIVEKYGGHLSVIAKDNVFNLNILFPFKEAA